MGYLPLASAVNVSQFSRDFMENYSPLCAFVNVFEGFLFGHCNISVSLVEYFSQGFGFLTTRQYLKISRFLKGEGEIVNMDFGSSFISCIAASCSCVQPYQTWYLLQEYCSVALIML